MIINGSLDPHDEPPAPSMSPNARAQLREAVLVIAMLQVYTVMQGIKE